MGKSLGRISGALAAIVALTVGVLGIVHIWPRWVWITLGIAGIVFIIGQFAWERRSGGTAGTVKVKQSQTGGHGSTNFQAGRDINYNDDSHGRGQ
jgi:hypothetical protein